jgi:hypothetical protein
LEKIKENLDGISSANFAELNLGLNVALAFWTLNAAVIWEDVFGFAELFAEDFVVE